MWRVYQKMDREESNRVLAGITAADAMLQSGLGRAIVGLGL
jgi:hypothetical protein